MYFSKSLYILCGNSSHLLKMGEISCRFSLKYNIFGKKAAQSQNKKTGATLRTQVHRFAHFTQ